MSNINPVPGSLKPNTPERALAEWLTAWQAQDWPAMAEASQLTWASQDANPAQFMELNFDFRELLKADLIRIQKHDDTGLELPMVARLITTKIQVQAFGPAPSSATVEAMVVCETAPYKSSPDGTWGVNPLSVLRGCP